MKRYRHYLTRPSRVDWPANIYCVQSGTDGNAAAQWVLRRGKAYSLLDCTELTSREAWRRYLMQTVCSGGNAVIVSYLCSRVWADLGLWEMIEDGTIQISTDPENRTADTGDEVSAVRQDGGEGAAVQGRLPLSRMRHQQSPYIVIDDPPCIIGFSCRGRPGRVTWIDVRNYGVDLHGEALQPMGCVQRLGRFMAQQSEISQALNLGSLRPTAGSQAMHAFRRSDNARGVYAHNDRDALALEAAGYYGGRAEAFRLGAIPFPVGHYDLRSSYGAVMARESLPVRLCEVVTGTRADELCRRCLDVPMVADVTVETDEPAYPYRRGNEVIWPVGRFRTILPGPELCDAILRHRVLRCHRCATYQADPCLREWANAVYGARRQDYGDGSELCGQWLKRLLVSIAGKLGQRNRQWIRVTNTGVTQPYGTWWASDTDGQQYRCHAIAGKVYREHGDGFAPDAIPAAAAWITSSGRMAVLSLIRAAGWESVVYCDTDAVIASPAGCANLCISFPSDRGGLGDLRAVWYGDGLHIYGVKHYREGERIVFGGVPRGSVVDLGDGIHYQHTPSAADEIRSGRRPQADPSVRVYPSRETYRLGHVQRDGRVTPFRVWED